MVIDYIAHPEATEALEAASRRARRSRGRRRCRRQPNRGFAETRAAAVESFGRLDIMVNNAGVETRTSVLDTTEDDYEKVLRINLKSAFFGTQLAAKQMIAQGGGGRIINLTSIHEDWPMPGNTAYWVSKGGMRMLTRTAGVELAPHGIPVVGVAPGAVATPINLVTMKDPAALARLDAAIPLGRMAKPEEIAAVVVVPGRRRCKLYHRHDDHRRRRHDAAKPRPLGASRTMPANGSKPPVPHCRRVHPAKPRAPVIGPRNDETFGSESVDVHRPKGS